MTARELELAIDHKLIDFLQRFDYELLEPLAAELGVLPDGDSMANDPQGSMIDAIMYALSLEKV